jgi:hypothetical protein
MPTQHTQQGVHNKSSWLAHYKQQHGAQQRIEAVKRRLWTCGGLDCLLAGRRKDSDCKVKFGACKKTKYHCYRYCLEAVQPSWNFYGMAQLRSKSVSFEEKTF